MTTAACIVIGDEILTGKVQETNAVPLTELLRELGVSLRRVVIIGDEVPVIAEEVRSCSQRYDYVFTSGGLGPTHDDRTMEGVALAFQVPVVRHPALEALVRQFFRGERLTPAALKMAEVPDGARLLEDEETRFPTVVIRNVYILPGIPQLFAAKLKRIGSELRGVRETLQSLYLDSDESQIAATLSQVAAEEPLLRIGSYPRMGDPDYRVRVTVEGTDGDAVRRALDRLLELLPPEQVLRVER